MSRNTAKLSLGDWLRAMRRALGNGLKPALVVIMVIMVISLVVGDWQRHSDDNQHDRQTDIVKMFNDIKGTPAQQTAARQELAQDLLNVRNHGVPVEELKDATALQQVKLIAKTGEPPSITPYYRSFWDRAGFNVLVGTGTTILFLSVGFGLLHRDAMRIRGRAHISDLPWIHGWPWLIPLLAPWLAPWLIIDYWLLRRERRSELKVKIDPRHGLTQR